jgi:hypothetical protein
MACLFFAIAALSSKPNQTKPNQTKPNQSKANQSKAVAMTILISNKPKVCHR